LLSFPLSRGKTKENTQGKISLFSVLKRSQVA